MYLVPRQGIEPGPLAVKVWNPNHWTAREFPANAFYRQGSLGTKTLAIRPRFPQMKWQIMGYQLF